jgi:hypothetical protein
MVSSPLVGGPGPYCGCPAIRGSGGRGRLPVDNPKKCLSSCVGAISIFNRGRQVLWPRRLNDHVIIQEGQGVTLEPRHTRNREQTTCRFGVRRGNGNARGAGGRIPR